MATKYKGTKEERLALDTFIKLVRATEAVTKRLQRIFVEEGLTETQFGVLEALFHLGSMNQRELAVKLLRSGGNITLVVDNLERDKLVKRERAKADRRAMIVSLTDRGRRLIRRIFPLHLVAIVEQFRVFSPREQATLQRLCRTLGRTNVPA